MFSSIYPETLFSFQVCCNIKIHQNLIGVHLFYSLHLGLLHYLAILMLNHLVVKIKAPKVFLIWLRFVLKTRRQDHQHPCRVIVLLIQGRVSCLLLLSLLSTTHSITQLANDKVRRLMFLHFWGGKGGIE